MVMWAKGPKCKLCGKTVQMLSYDAAYVKIVKPGEEGKLRLLGLRGEAAGRKAWGDYKSIGEAG